MARPCGCAGERGTYIGVNGISITGDATVRDPGRVGLNNPITGAGCDAVMSCVGARLGPGLRFNPVSQTIAAALSADGGNALIYGTDNGLYSTGGSGGGGGGATVDGLAALTDPIIGGSYGAGLSMWPEGPIDTYEAAMSMGLNLIHVPVRRSREYLLWAQRSRSLGFYNYRYAAEVTNGMDLTQGQHLWYTPAGDPGGAWQSPTYANQAGYFGFGARDRRGMPRLSDVLALTQRRVVLYLQALDVGASVNDTAAPRDTIANMRAVIGQFGAQQNVIVGAQFPAAASSADLSSISTGMQQVRDYGVAIAAHINSQAEADMLPPATLVDNGYSWVFLDCALMDTNPDTFTAYKDAGLNVMAHSVHRQYQWNGLGDETRFGAGGLKGALCYDPIYAAGKESNYRYWRSVATWGWGTPDYGRHSNWSATIEGQRDRYRGYVVAGNGGTICLDGDVLLPNDTPGDIRASGYYILMGENCRPAPVNAVTGMRDNYDIECGFIWDALVGDRRRWMGVWFGNPEDRPLLEWTQCNEYTRGYQLQLNQNGSLVIQRYDGVPSSVEPPYAYSLAWDSPWRNNIQPGVEYRVKIRVRPDRIICGPANQNEGGTHTRTFDATTGGGDLWRGPYAYIGRHFFYNSDSTRCRFRNFSLTDA